VVIFIGGGNRNILRKPPTCCKSLTNFQLHSFLSWNIVESGVKCHNTNPNPLRILKKYTFDLYMYYRFNIGSCCCVSLINIWLYMFNQFLSLLNLIPTYGKMHSRQHYVIKFVSDLQQVGGFLRLSTIFQLRNECNCFNWQTGDEWRVSVCGQMWITDDEWTYSKLMS
jgi:hypothetical protein